MPKVSVIIPAYKAAPFIGETLQSVFAQTLTDYEILLINDGSPDTEALELAIAPFRDRINYIKQENRGASAARNAGLSAAQGELIAFLDADDVWLPEYLQEQINFLQQQGANLVCADAIHFGGSRFDDRTYAETLMPDFPDIGRVTFVGLLSGQHNIVTSGVVAYRKSILEVGLFDEALRNSQDFDLWLRMTRSGKRLFFQRRVLLRYRFHANSLSGDDINRNVRELRIYDKIEQAYNLTPFEKSVILPVIQNRRALLEFELGKLYLAAGDFSRARAAFGRANNLSARWKSLLMMWLTQLAPALAQTLYLRQRA